MPLETIEAFQDHGEVARTLEQGLDEARKRVRGARARPASTTTTSTDTLEREGVEKFADSFDELLDGVEREARRARPGVTTSAARARRADLGARPDALDRAATRRSGSAGSTSRCACSSACDELLESSRRGSTFERRRAARHGRLEPRAGGAAAARSASTRSTSSTRRTRARSAAESQLDSTARSSSPRPSRARRSRRARTSTTSGSSSASGDRFVAITDPGSALERLAARARVPSTSFHGEPTIGGRYSALSPFGIVPAVLMGVDVRAAARARRGDARGLPRSATATRASSSGSQLGEAGARAATRLRRRGGGFGLWVEQLLAESTGKQGKGLVPASGEGGRAGPPAAGLPRRRPVRARPGVLPLGVRDRGRRLDPRDQPVRPAQRPGGEGQDERGARARRRAVGSSPRATLDELLAQARARATTSRSRRSSTPRARASSSRSSSARARRGRVVTRRARPALPALDRPAAQGRAEHRPLRPGRRRPRRGAADPRASRSASGR